MEALFEKRLPAERVPELQDAIAKLAKKARRLGVAEPRVELVGESFVERVKSYDEAGRELALFRRFQIVAVHGEAPRLPGGYRFLGTLQHTDAGNILRCVPDAELPERFRTEPPKCEHCEAARRRKDTFVVASEAGEHKQVGRNCLRDFLGHESPERILAMVGLFEDILGLGDPDDVGGGGGGGEHLEAPLECFLAHTVAVIGEHGWMSVSNARAAGVGLDTKTRVLANLGLVKRDPGEKEIPVTEQHTATAEAALAWLRGEVGVRGARNDYEHNLLVACAQPSVSWRNAGIVASLISSFQRAQGEKVRREYLGRFNTKDSKPQGAEGERTEWRLTLIEKLALGRDDGTTYYLHKFADAGGNAFTWFSSRETEFEAGVGYLVRGTVKRHTEFRGVQQTVLSRCLSVPFGKPARRRRKANEA